eukprot:TRINITY_DN4769_c0_g1_i3.p1 TRINITY_DN4769_c0_g1~~TRINITY_DN4769_c0_g1_i3.p1  ORF type:complete len:398 (-),score=71.40 TRINITY_DN4769_c0_g1_i3:93-1286(-)
MQTTCKLFRTSRTLQYSNFVGTFSRQRNFSTVGSFQPYPLIGTSSTLPSSVLRNDISTSFKNFCSESRSLTKEQKRAHLRAEGKEMLSQIRERKKIEKEEKEPVIEGWIPRLMYAIRKMYDVGWQFWYGARDLWRNTKAANELARRLKQGEKLPRVQHRFILQNRRDLRSLVPFFLVWRIPIFGDFILPFFIARYPNLLPSTFKLVKKPTLEDRIKTARIKHEAILGGQVSSDKLNIISKLDSKWKSLPYLTSKNVVAEADLLSQLKLKSLTRSEVAALSSMLGLGTRMPTFWLKRKLIEHFKMLEDDNKLLQKEGVESLSEDELDAATMERGLRVIHLSLDALERQLNEFVKLQNERPDLIAPLLIYGHSFNKREMFLQPEGISTSEQKSLGAVKE